MVKSSPMRALTNAAMAAITDWLKGIDQVLERAVLQKMSPHQQVWLLRALGLGLALGVALAWWQPGVGGLCLVFPVMIHCFFLGPRAAWLVAPMGLLHHLKHPAWQEDAVFFGAGALGIVFAGVTAHRFRESRARQLNLEEAVQVARQVQRGLEPATTLHCGELQMASLLRVCRHLGGDFLCARPTPSGIQVVLGDVMGKGLPAAILAAFLKGTTEELLGQGRSPAEIVATLNHHMVEHCQDRFATLLSLEVDLHKREWRVCRAGHELPMLLRQDGQLSELVAGHSLPVGLEPHELYSEHRWALQPGDWMVLCSDGVSLDRERVSRVLQGGIPGRVESLLPRILDPQDLYALQDDVTVALIRVDPALAQTAPGLLGNNGHKPVDS